jgi:hypothetical protein
VRDLTVANGRLDAPCHRMKRLESWRVLIDAEHMASDLGIRPSRCLSILPTFPDSGNSFATIGISFTQGDWSAHAAIAILRSRDVSCSSCSQITGCPKAACASDSQSSAGAKPASGAGFGPNCQHWILVLTRFLLQISLRNLRKLDCYANRYPLRSKTLSRAVHRLIESEGIP